MGDVAEQAGLDHAFAGLDQVRRAAPLHVDLDHAAVLPCRRQHRLAFDDIGADGLLHVDIGARLDRRDHRQRVPVIGRGHVHDVQLLLFEHLAVVAVGARRLLRHLAGGDHLGGLGHHVPVHVTEGDDLDRGDLEQPEQRALAVPARPDQGDTLGLGLREGGDESPKRR
jgi:hypothetical protein